MSDATQAYMRLAQEDAARKRRDLHTQELIDEARRAPTPAEIAEIHQADAEYGAAAFGLEHVPAPPDSADEVCRRVQEQQARVAALLSGPHTVLIGESHSAYQVFVAAARELEAHQREGRARMKAYQEALAKLSAVAARGGG